MCPKDIEHCLGYGWYSGNIRWMIDVTLLLNIIIGIIIMSANFFSSFTRQQAFKQVLFTWIAKSYLILITLGGKYTVNLMLQITYAYDGATKTEYLGNLPHITQLGRGFTRWHNARWLDYSR